VWGGGGGVWGRFKKEGKGKPKENFLRGGEEGEKGEKLKL